MSDNLQKLSISWFSQSDSRTHLCYVRIPVFTVWKVFGSHVFSNKRRLTGNRPGSERRETGRKKLLPQHPYFQLCGTGWVVILTGGYPGTRYDGR